MRVSDRTGRRLRGWLAVAAAVATLVGTVLGTAWAIARAQGWSAQSPTERMDLVERRQRARDSAQDVDLAEVRGDLGELRRSVDSMHGDVRTLIRLECYKTPRGLRRVAGFPNEHCD